jgi:hypothetical protein
MEPQSIAQVSKQVFQRFPDLRGSQPTIQPYAGGQFLLIFKGSAQAADGRTITQTIRVVAGADGSIKKMTASR